MKVEVAVLGSPSLLVLVVSAESNTELSEQKVMIREGWSLTTVGFLSVCLCLSVCVSLFVCLSVCLSVCLFVCVRARVFVCGV